MKDNVKEIIDKTNLIALRVLDKLLAGDGDVGKDDLLPYLLSIKEIKDLIKVNSKVASEKWGRMFDQDSDEYDIPDIEEELKKYVRLRGAKDENN